MGIVLLVVGLLIGAAIGFYAAPRSTPPPANEIALSGTRVYLAVVSGPGNALSFAIGGLTDPTIRVARGANVTVFFRNVDSAQSHSWVLLSSGPPYAAEPPMDIAFPGAGSPDMMMGTMPAGYATFAFTASTAGTYWYVCHVSAHAAGGMYGQFLVTT